MQEYYTVYKTINLVNGKTYIGIHQTDNPNDDYLGSEITFKRMATRPKMERNKNYTN